MPPHDASLTPHDGEDLDTFVARYIAAQQAERARFRRLHAKAMIAEMQADLEACWPLNATSLWHSHQRTVDHAFPDATLPSARSSRLDLLEERVALLETIIETLRLQIAAMQRHRNGQ